MSLLVNAKITPSREPSCAVLALKWALFCVNSHMNAQVTFLSKLLVTVGLKALVEA